MSEYIVNLEGELGMALAVACVGAGFECEEIVRCRDCKHHELQTVSYSDKPLSVCTAEWCEGAEGDNPLVEPDGFCAWGERQVSAVERTCHDASVDSSTQFYCSECECTVDVPLLWGEVNYCPNCGAKVVDGVN